MPKAFVIDRCMFCGNLPCTCAKSTSRHPTKVQDTRRSAGPGKPDQVTPQESEPETPPPAESEPPENVIPIDRPTRAKPPGRSLKSMSTRAPAPTSSAPVTAPVDTEPVDFGAARTASADADMERAIRVLRDAGLIHPDDPHNSAQQRAAAWRAKQWRAQHAK